MPYRRGFMPFSLILLAALLTGCGDPAPPGDAPRAQSQPSILVIAPKLTGGLISGPVIEEAERFGEAHGARVRVVTPGWNETVERIRASLAGEGPRYDVFLITTSWSGALFEADAALELPPEVQQQAGWEDILPIYRDNLLTWNGKPYALPYDGDTVTLFYRKDLFENPAYRARFLKETGQALTPPRTWRELHQIAAFFTGWDWDGDGEIEYGLAGNRLANGSAMLIFLSRAAAYAKDPHDPAFYFDPRTMAPRIDNPGFVRALEEYLQALQYGPPGMSNFAGNDVRRAFATGEVAMAVDWANIGIVAAGSPMSVVKDKVGYAPLPGARQVYDACTERWREDFNQPAAMVGNYLFLVNKDSPQRQLALDFVLHMTSPELTKRLTVTPGAGVNPSRFSHLADPVAWQAYGFSVDSAGRFLDTLQQALATDNHIFDIRIPGSARYYRLLDQAIQRALTGEASAAESLRAAARAWDEATDSLGREHLRALYLQSLNAPPRACNDPTSNPSPSPDSQR